MKFLFNLQTQTLKVEKGEYWLVLGEERKFFHFSSLGFYLDPEEPNHRIIFSVYQEIIQALYKVPCGENFNYYKREINRPLSGIIEFEFSEWDRIEKIKDQWISKKAN